MKYAAVYWRHYSRYFELHDSLLDAVERLENGAEQGQLNPESYWCAAEGEWHPIPEDQVQAVFDEMERVRSDRAKQWIVERARQRRCAVIVEGPDGLTDTVTGTIDECAALHQDLAANGVRSRIVGDGDR